MLQAQLIARFLTLLKLAHQDLIDKVFVFDGVADKGVVKLISTLDSTAFLSDTSRGAAHPHSVFRMEPNSQGSAEDKEYHTDDGDDNAKSGKGYGN